MGMWQPKEKRTRIGRRSANVGGVGKNGRREGN